MFFSQFISSNVTLWLVILLTCGLTVVLFPVLPHQLKRFIVIPIFGTMLSLTFIGAWFLDLAIRSQV